MGRSGFTLLEVMVYLALAAIFLGGILSCAYALTVSAGIEQTKILLQSEAQFLTGKFDWAVLGAQNFSTSDDGQILTIVKYNQSQPIIFSAENGHVALAVNGNAPAGLNADPVKVDSLMFRDVPATDTQPEGVAISFTLKTQDNRGHTINQNFTFTEYLKQ